MDTAERVGSREDMPLWRDFAVLNMVIMMEGLSRGHDQDRDEYPFLVFLDHESQNESQVTSIVI